MKSNKTTNRLLAIIALALLLNAFNPWIQPSITTAAARQIDEFYLMGIEASLSGIQISLSNIENNGSPIQMQMP